MTVVLAVAACMHTPSADQEVGGSSVGGGSIAPLVEKIPAGIVGMVEDTESNLGSGHSLVQLLCD